MSPNCEKTSVAFVYPPYGPPNLANLGLAILSAGLKQQGFPCRTFYWNYRFTDALPYHSVEQKRNVYTLLTQRDFFPWNEWLFMRSVCSEELRDRDAEVLHRLAQLDLRLADQTSPIPPSHLILYLCNSVGALLKEMADELAGFNVVGISTTFFQNGATLALANHIKARWPDKVIVLGGANCDGEMGRALIERFPFVDYVFSGEVDHVFPEFIRRIDEGLAVDALAGIHFHDGSGNTTSGPPPRPIDDMNGLPIPDFDDFVAERKRFGLYRDGELCLPLESSRGCWWGAKHHCVFCGLNANGMAYRQKDHERFEREVESIVDRYGARYLFMADNILSAKYYRDFVYWAGERSIDVDFFYEIKANVNRQHVADLADASITMVQPGIESFSTSILRLMRKGVKGIQNVAFLKYAGEYGIFPAYNILAGFPGENPYEYEWMARELPKLVHLMPPNGVINVEFHRFSPFHNDPDGFGIRLRPHEYYSFIFPFEEEMSSRLAYFFELEGRAPHDLSYLAQVKDLVREWIQRYHADGCTLTWRRDHGGIIIKDRRHGFAACDYHLRDHAIAVFEALDAPITLEAAARKAGVSVEAQASDDEVLPAPPRPASRSASGPSWHRQPSVTHWPLMPELLWAVQPGAQPFTADPDRIITFTAKEFSDEPAACLEPLVGSGIIYVDDGLYVTLPVNEEARSNEHGWTRLGL